MSERKTDIRRLMQVTFGRGAWHPALKPSLEGLSAEQAAWKPAPERNSIHEIVQHLTRWKRAALADLRGESPDLKGVEASDWQRPGPDQEAWQRDVAELLAVSEALAEHLRERDEASLDETLASFRSPAAFTLLAMAAHDAYHTGQIQYLRKLQGV